MEQQGLPCQVRFKRAGEWYKGKWGIVIVSANHLLLRLQDILVPNDGRVGGYRGVSAAHLRGRHTPWGVLGVSFNLHQLSPSASLHPSHWPLNPLTSPGSVLPQACAIMAVKSRQANEAEAAAPLFLTLAETVDLTQPSVPAGGD